MTPWCWERNNVDKQQWYDSSAKYFQCNQKTQRVVALMRKEETKKNIKNINQQRWQWNDAVLVVEKQTHRNRMTRRNNEY